MGILDHLDFWLALIALGAMGYFLIWKDRVQPFVQRLRSSQPKPPASRPTRRRVPIRRVDGKLNGSFSVTNDVTTKFTPSKPLSTAPAGDVTPPLPVTPLVTNVTWEEAARIGLMLAQKIAPSEIAKTLPGYTPGKYKEFKAKVDQVKAALETEESTVETV